VRRPDDILRDGLDRAIAVLIDGIRGVNKWDFVDEFDAYWSNIEGTAVIISHIEPDDNLRKIIAARSEVKDTKGSYLFVADDDSAFSAFYNSDKRDKLTHITALYIPLPAGTLIEPFDKADLIPKNIRSRIISRLQPGERKKVRKLTRKYKSEELVIFRVVRSNEGEVLFGILFRGVHNQHPLMDGGCADETIPLVIKRQDKSFLLPRGGANLILQDKKVALVGCGSVGGNLAFHLVHSGILNLTLIDYDDLRTENLFRHRLGKNYIGKSKAEALKEEISRNFPFVSPTAFKLSIEEIISKELIILKDFDLIIIAIGNDVSSLYLNKMLFPKQTPPILYTWLEPYGIGGHVLVTKHKELEGCFQCIFTPVPGDDPAQFVNRSAFAASNQTFTKDIAGCANRFTPYSSLDADRTALLAAKVAIQLLLGETEGNRLFSWKGDSAEFESEGFKTSERFRSFDAIAQENGIKFSSINCPICRISSGRDETK
jgi:molybdopterin/thiamine biosynthesis adenylyltransferase